MFYSFHVLIKSRNGVIEIVFYFDQTRCFFGHYFKVERGLFWMTYILKNQ